jgi:hypothetical protein
MKNGRKARRRKVSWLGTVRIRLFMNVFCNRAPETTVYANCAK